MLTTSENMYKTKKKIKAIAAGGLCSNSSFDMKAQKKNVPGET
jgi:hypothetical protein